MKRRPSSNVLNSTFTTRKCKSEASSGYSSTNSLLDYSTLDPEAPEFIESLKISLKSLQSDDYLYLSEEPVLHYPCWAAWPYGKS